MSTSFPVSSGKSVGRILLETAKGDTESRTLTPQEVSGIMALLDAGAQRARRYFSPPLRFIEPISDSDHNGPCIVDSRGQIVAKLFWPGHPVEETEAAEQATYALGRAMAATLGQADE